MTRQPLPLESRSPDPEDERDDLDLLIEELSNDDPAFWEGVEDIAHRKEVLRHLIGRRKELRLSQQAVASAMGTTQSAVSDLENGAGDVFVSTLQRYARAVGTRIELLVCAGSYGVVDDVRTVSVVRGNTRADADDWQDGWQRMAANRQYALAA
jgi:transcriptional regulator with XRE-family HTH domain